MKNVKSVFKQFKHRWTAEFSSLSVLCQYICPPEHFVWIFIFPPFAFNFLSFFFSPTQFLPILLLLVTIHPLSLSSFCSLSHPDHHCCKPAYLRCGADWQFTFPGISFHHQQLCKQWQGNEGMVEINKASVGKTKSDQSSESNIIVPTKEKKHENKWCDL